MSYATLMVHMEFGQSNERRLQIASDLAERFHADVIGIAACQPMQIDYGEAYVSGELIEQDRAEIEIEMKDAEAEFRRAIEPRAATLEWRSTVSFASLSDYVAREARSADLVITGATSRNLIDGWRRVNCGDLVMQTGRPVLVVPAAVGKWKLERVVVAWKDTRETRRAAVDALPLLKKAAHVTVVEIVDEEYRTAVREHLDDVVGRLKRHGVVAEAFASSANDDDATRLSSIAREQDADLIVAGAYGHNRVREWMLGGVTRDLLLRGERCSLVSH